MGGSVTRPYGVEGVRGEFVEPNKERIRMVESYLSGLM